MRSSSTKRSVHFERRLHYARELYLRQIIFVILVPTDKMMADDKTKAVQDRAKVIKCRDFQINYDG